MNECEQSLLDKLLSMLVKIENDKDFLIGVISNAENPVGWQKIIDFIKEYPNVDSEQVLLYSLLVSSDEA